MFARQSTPKRWSVRFRQGMEQLELRQLMTASAMMAVASADALPPDIHIQPDWAKREHNHEAPFDPQLPDNCGPIACDAVRLDGDFDNNGILDHADINIFEDALN